MKCQRRVARTHAALLAIVVLLFAVCKGSAVTYPPLSSFLYGNTGVNAPPEKSFVQGSIQGPANHQL
jgi:hypothetical protein